MRAVAQLGTFFVGSVLLVAAGCSGDPAPEACAPATEACNGVDDDCDGAADEGCACVAGEERACYGGPVATRGIGACRDGVQTCTDGAWAAPCGGEQLPGIETCNGIDDDCDGETDRRDPCDTGLPGACGAGVEQCADGAFACVQVVFPAAELCNGVDDDCDPATGDSDDDGRLGVACDGPDSDLCQEGVLACVAGEGGGAGIACLDDTASTLDVCNGLDDDCDGTSQDGDEDPLAGAACDGPDTDLCAEGAWSCIDGALACSDGTGSIQDWCNGVDDDCNPATGDGSGDPLLGAACDGPDGDRCAEGTLSCGASGLVCDDDTSTTVEVCENQADDDCDGATDEPDCTPA